MDIVNVRGEVKRKSFTGGASLSSADYTRDRLDSRPISDYSTALHLNSIPSIDLEEEKPQHSARTETSIFDQQASSDHLNNYLFESQSFLGDFEENIVAKREEKLQKYCIYKAKKWSTQKKK